MTKARIEGDAITIWCPGCKGYHRMPIKPANPNGWDFSGDADHPTLNPSILVRTGHFAPHAKQDGVCWCTYNAEHPDKPAPFKCGICHSFVRDGKIQFLSDCTHDLAGQTVDLPEFQ